MRPLTIEQTSPLGPWPEGILPVHCFACRLPLCIGMPREEPADRLVGTCVGCWAKYVIAWVADGTEALIGRLPDADDPAYLRRWNMKVWSSDRCQPRDGRGENRHPGTKYEPERDYATNIFCLLDSFQLVEGFSR